MNHDALEHSSGLRPLGEYPDHCAACARRASCAHEDVNEVKTWGGELVAMYCAGCGLDMKPHTPVT